MELFVFFLPDGLALNANSGAGRDPDIGARIPMRSGAPSGDALGSYQDDLFRSQSSRPLFTSSLVTMVGGVPIFQILGDTNGPPYIELLRIPAVGHETRPKNVNVYYIIKE